MIRTISFYVFLQIKAFSYTSLENLYSLILSLLIKIATQSKNLRDRDSSLKPPKDSIVFVTTSLHAIWRTRQCGSRWLVFQTDHLCLSLLPLQAPSTPLFLLPPSPPGSSFLYIPRLVVSLQLYCIHFSYLGK